VEPQFPDSPAKVTGIGLTEVLGLLGEQADVEVDPAEVTVAQCGQPGTNFRLDLDPIQSSHASDAICI
jgi:DNA primase